MGAEYVPVGPDVSVETLIASEPPTASEPIAIQVIKRACEIGSFIVATIMLAVLALIVLVIVLALVIAFVGLLAFLWYLLYWAATPESSLCSESEASASSYWRVDDDCVVDDDCGIGMVWANIMVGFICVIWGIVAFFGLCSLRNQSYSDSDCKCDATRVNTIGCLWVGILAVWALQYVMIFVVRVVGLSAMVPLLHIAVIAIVYPIDYYIGELIHPHNTDTETENV